MRSSSAVRSIARLLFVFVLILSVPAFAVAVLYAEPFEPLRRAKVEQLLSDAIDAEVEVRGPVTISSGWAPTVTIEDIVTKESLSPTDLKELSAKSLRIEVPLLPLLAGSPQFNTLVVDGLSVFIEIPQGGAKEDEDGLDVADIIGEFVRSPFAADLRLRDATLHYVNHDSGFDLRYAFDEIASQSAEDGGVSVNGTGKLNGELWTLDGDIDPPDEDEDRRKFVFALDHVGLNLSLAGIYEFDSSLLNLEGDTVDMSAIATAPNLKRLFAIYGVSGDLEGSGELSSRLSGSLDALKLADLSLKLTFETGDTYEVSGAVGDIATGTDLDLKLAGTFAQETLPEDQARPVYDIGITGFDGRIEGSLQGVLMRDFFVSTSSVRANLRGIGPITAERLYRDNSGRLGLYDVQVLAGDPKRPSVRVAGTVKDIIAFKGVDLKGNIDFLTADVLDLAAEEHAEELGHLSGDVAISDADGSLGIEHLSAQVTDSDLIKLSVQLVFDDIPDVAALTFATHLDIPKFKPFAAALGSQVEEVGQVKFDGSVAGSDDRIVMAGTTLVGRTAVKSSLVGSLSADRKPVLSGDIATDLLYLADLTKLASINAVYRENLDEQDADVFDYSKVWETLLVDMQVKVAKIAGGGTGASHIQGRITYLAGTIGLEPLTLTYLAGRASANGEINTSGNQNTFALKGSVNSLPVGAVLKEMQVNYPVSGALNLTYDLTGAGSTSAQIPPSLNGSLSASLRNGWIGTGLLDLAGMSLPAWLLTRTQAGNQASLVCAVAPFSFRNGRASTQGLVLETNNVQVVGAGSIDFRGDTVDLHFKPQALQAQFVKTAQPFAIQGRLGNPKVSLTGTPVAGAVVGTLASPLNLLATIVQPKAGTPGRVPCQITRTAAQGGAPAASAPRQRSGPLGLGIFGGQKRR